MLSQLRGMKVCPQPLTDRERTLIKKHLDFYRALDRGDRIPDTIAQITFVRVCRGYFAPRTKHEVAYAKWTINQEVDRREAIKSVVRRLKEHKQKEEKDRERAERLAAERQARIDAHEKRRAIKDLSKEDCWWRDQWAIPHHTN